MARCPCVGTCWLCGLRQVPAPFWPNSQVMVRRSETTQWGSQRGAWTGTTMSCDLASPSLSRLEVFSKRTLLCGCYLSPLKWVPAASFLFPGREDGAQCGWRDGAVGLGYARLADDHPPVSSDLSPHTEPPEPAHLGADGRGRPHLLLPVTLRLRAGAPGAPQAPPPHPEGVSAARTPRARAQGHFLLTRGSAPLCSLEAGKTPRPVQSCRKSSLKISH